METRKQSEEEERRNMRALFKKMGHKAYLLQNDPHFLRLIWQVPGSMEYGIRYLLDKDNGILYLSGDMGACIAGWHHPQSAHKIAGFLQDTGYFMSKIEASSDLYTCTEEDLEADILDEIREHCGTEDEITEFLHTQKETGENPDWTDMVDHPYFRQDFKSEWEDFCSGLEDDCIRGDRFYPDEARRDFFEDYLGSDYPAGLSDWGRRVHPRVFAWAAGFQMAVKDLTDAGLIGKDD